MNHSNFITAHMIDDDFVVAETTEAWQQAQRPMRGSCQAIEDGAIAAYLDVLQKTGDRTAAGKAYAYYFKTSLSCK